jgi:hypothetical protein
VCLNALLHLVLVNTDTQVHRVRCANQLLCTHMCSHTHSPPNLLPNRPGSNPLSAHTVEVCGYGAEHHRTAGVGNSVLGFCAFCPNLRILPLAPARLGRMGLPCQLCMFFGEMKVSLPRIKKGNECNWLHAFLHPFMCWAATLLGTVWTLCCRG